MVHSRRDERVARRVQTCALLRSVVLYPFTNQNLDAFLFLFSNNSITLVCIHRLKPVSLPTVFACLTVPHFSLQDLQNCPITATPVAVTGNAASMFTLAPLVVDGMAIHDTTAAPLVVPTASAGGSSVLTSAGFYTAVLTAFACKQSLTACEGTADPPYVPCHRGAVRAGQP